jgi:predicted transglutaminase-like cysteine proteinase
MSAFVRLLRIFLLGAVCCSTAFADMHPSQVSLTTNNAPESQPAPENNATQRAALPLGMEPFGLPASAAQGTISSKWNELQSRILDDARALAACRADESTCSDSARRFLSIVELGGKQEGRARIGSINRAVNLSIRPTSDWAQYGYADFWASPLQTLGSGAGDCEDYAIVKYLVLRELGFSSSDLRLVIVRDDKHQTEHAVTAIRYEQRWLILDNRTLAILDAEDANHYRPLYALHQDDARPIATAAVERVISR